MITTAGNSKPRVFDGTNKRFAIGDPEGNIVSVFVVASLFADGFD